MYIYIFSVLDGQFGQLKRYRGGGRVRVVQQTRQMSISGQPT